MDETTHTEPNATPTLQCHILDTGYCLASEHHMLRGGRHLEVQCHALIALLKHPEHGWFLWDTGYAPHMLTATQKFPYRLYRTLTPLRFKPEEAVVAQLPHLGLTPDDIRTIVISHFHADHISGLLDFPRTTYVAGQTAYSDIALRRGWPALLRGFLPELLPVDFTARLQLITSFQGPTLPGLGATHDLFGDGSVLLMPLPGHARGQIGMLAHTTRGPILFAADGAWMRQAIRERRRPAGLARLIIDNMAEVQTTLDRLYEFSQARPDVCIIPTHCPEAYHEEIEQAQSREDTIYGKA